MRKRKSPIVLVTMLVVVVAGVAGFQFATSRVASPDAPPAAPPVENTEQVGQARPATDPKSISASVKQSMGSTGKPTPSAAPIPGGPDGPGGPGGGGPLILNPQANVAREKPKPNSTATSAQWYSEESGMGSKKD